MTEVGTRLDDVKARCIRGREHPITLFYHAKEGVGGDSDVDDNDHDLGEDGAGASRDNGDRGRAWTTAARVDPRPRRQRPLRQRRSRTRPTAEKAVAEKTSAETAAAEIAAAETAHDR